MDERLRHNPPLHRPHAKVIDFYLYPAAAIVTVRQLIHRARALYRWDNRPRTRRLR